MKKVLSVAAIALMVAGSSAFAGETGTACSADKKSECSAKKAECSAQKSECSAKKSECSAKKAECTKD